MVTGFFQRISLIGLLWVLASSSFIEAAGATSKKTIDAKYIKKGNLAVERLPIATGTWNTNVGIQTNGNIEQGTGAYLRSDSLRARDNSTGLAIESADGTDVIFIDMNGLKIGIKKSQPTEDLDVAGTVKATSFIGDGSQLTGIIVTGSQLPPDSTTSGDFQLQDKQRLIYNSFSAAGDLSLPTATPGNWFEVMDAGNASVNNFRILTGGAKINGQTSNFIITTNGLRLRGGYLNAAYGWKLWVP
jgi:hypothetical protein